MKDFRYYEGQEVPYPERLFERDFTTITAELYSLGGGLVDTITTKYDRDTIKQLKQANYKISESVDTKAHVAHNKEFSAAHKVYADKIEALRKEFISDIAKELNLVGEDELYKRAEQIHGLYSDYLYDNDSFKREYPIFHVYYDIMLVMSRA